MDKCQIAHQCQVKKKVSWLFFNFTSKCQLDWIGIFVHKLWRHNWEGPWSSPYFSPIVQSLFCSHFLNELFEHIFIHKSIVLLLLTTHVLQGQASYMSQLGLGGGGHCALNRVLGGHFLGIKISSEINVWDPLCHILVVFEVPARPQVKGMSENS